MSAWWCWHYWQTSCWCLLLAYGITRIIPLDEPLKIGLIVLATCAGAPFLILEAKGAKANLGVAVGVMTLLMVVTIFYLPVVLPLLLTGVEVDAGAIAQSLIVLMLIPLILGLLVKAHSPDTAKNWAPAMNKIGALGIVTLLVVGLGLNVANVISLIGTGGFLALLLFIVGSLLIGFVVGGRDPGVRNVMGLGTAQRNVSAAHSHYATKFFWHDCSPVCAGGSDPHPIDLITARALAGQPRCGTGTGRSTGYTACCLRNSLAAACLVLISNVVFNRGIDTTR